ncbi:AAA family ATPase [Streptomyces sp. TRM 70351]|uniref:helix-turn-helix transcriptional regulator n=1 Tax=Streptomyces sp. TRM 70351 TaxID=3116552 RepID=UPI002E7B8002|nr:AAA family ATPase [Streptomyces sp. TRM 70351]MEE1927876.1 AAA family ATPase [Streptomyces sp. TRM 70351]
MLPGERPPAPDTDAVRADTVVRRSETPVLIGRTGELHTLLDALACPPAVVLVEGEAGIGKTRLIREALGHASLRGRPVLAGGCHPLREPFPYGPVFDLLRRLAGRVPGRLDPVCGALRPYLPELARDLPPAPEPLADHRAAQHRLFRAVRALLDALGRAVVVVEDLHWADDGTRDLVRFLVDDPPGGLAAVLSYRREELPGAGLPLGRAYRRPPGTTSALVPLAPLDVAAVRSMAAALTGTPAVPGELARELHERTAGIPFVVEEVVRALPPGVTGREPLDALAVPTLLHEAMADRMALLSPQAARCVQATAVLRVPAGEELVAAVTGAESGTPLREALLAGVLHEVERCRYGFRHALAQQAVYGSLPGPLRRDLHRRAMRALAALEAPPLVQLAYHARQAEELAAWRRYAEAAAEAARARGDLALAVELLEGLLTEGRLPALERARLAVRLSEAALNGLTHRRASALLRRVVEDAHVPDGLRGEIRLNLGLLLNNQAGDYEQGRVDTETAVEELRERPALAARGMAALAMPTWGDHPCRVYRRWIARAEELVAREPDGALRIAVRGNHLALLLSLGEPGVRARADALLARGGTAAERVQVARMCANLADAAAWQGHDGDAHHYRRVGEGLAREHGAPYVRSLTEGTALRLEWHGGRWTELAGRATRALEDMGGHDGVGGLSGLAVDASLVLGLLALARGEWDEAAARLDAAGPADPANASAPALAVASGALVRLRVARGEVAAACAEAERAVRRVRRKGIWVWASELVPMAVTAYVRGERSGDAEALTAEFAAGVAGRGSPLAAAALDACRGVLALAGQDPRGAAAAFDAARRGYAALPRPYAAARAKEAAARSRLALGLPEGPGELAAAADEFAALGATRDAARCRRVLRGSGVVTPSRRGRRGYGDALSPREREVARLVALGHTNREIAAVLFLSPRTIEQHVARVLRKLRVASRDDVAEPPPSGGAP